MSPGPEQPPPLCTDKHTPLCQHPASGRKGTLLSAVTRCFQTPRSTRRAERRSHSWCPARCDVLSIKRQLLRSSIKKPLTELEILLHQTQHDRPPQLYVSALCLAGLLPVPTATLLPPDLYRYGRYHLLHRRQLPSTELLVQRLLVMTVTRDFLSPCMFHHLPNRGRQGVWGPRGPYFATEGTEARQGTPAAGCEAGADEVRSRPVWSQVWLCTSHLQPLVPTIFFFFQTPLRTV